MIFVRINAPVKIVRNVWVDEVFIKQVLQLALKWGLGALYQKFVDELGKVKEKDDRDCFTDSVASSY